MIETKTYLIVGSASVPIESVTTPPPKPSYVGGSVELRVDGEPVLLQSTHDLVDQLWAYLVQAAAEVAAGKDAAFSYPDQPMRVTFTGHGDAVTIEVAPPHREYVRRGTAPRAELVRAIADGAEAAFLHLETLLPGAYDAELRDARALRGMPAAQ